MSTATPVMFAFRCTRCWQSNLADGEQCGSEVQCRHCGQALVVPEATPQRIALAEEVSLSLAKHPPSGQLLQDSPPSDGELRRLLQQECYVPMGQRDFSHYPAASILSRLIAVIIDGLVTIAVVGVGLWLGYMLFGPGPAHYPAQAMRPSIPWPPTVLILMGSFVVMLCVGQWILLSTCGQTIGKMLTSIRIVSMSGRVPGFVQAVVLRNWLRSLLSMIPLFSLIDLLFGLFGDHRCIHDWISGTRVVSEC